MQAVFALALTDASAPRGRHNPLLCSALLSPMCRLPRPAANATTARGSRSNTLLTNQVRTSRAKTQQAVCLT